MRHPYNAIGYFGLVGHFHLVQRLISRLPQEFNSPTEYYQTLDNYVVAIEKIHSMKDWAIVEQIAAKEELNDTLNKLDDWHICRDIAVISKHGKISSPSRQGPYFIVASHPTSPGGKHEFWYQNNQRKIERKLHDALWHLIRTWEKFLEAKGYSKQQLAPPSNPEYRFPNMVPM